MNTQTTNKTYISGIYPADQLEAMCQEITNNENVEYYATNTNDYELMFDVLMLKTKKQLKEIFPDIADYEGSNWKKEDCVKLLIAPYNLRSSSDNITETETKINTNQGERKMRTKKLNKSEQWAKVEAAVSALQDQDQGLMPEDVAMVLDALSFLRPSTGGAKVSNKYNPEDNTVYCNYFEEYIEADRFNKKRMKNGQQGWKANSILAEQILRKIKNTKQNATKQATEAFMSKLIDANEMAEILDRADQIGNIKYLKVDEVPTVADIVGLSLDK